MTNQIPAENTTTSEEIQAAFGQSYGPMIGQLTFQKLALEKQNQSLQSRLGDVEEIAFGLKRDNANLIKNQIAREGEVYRLEAEIAALSEAGPTADQIAAQGKAIIDGDGETAGKEKAASTEAA